MWPFNYFKRRRVWKANIWWLEWRLMWYQVGAWHHVLNGCGVPDEIVK